MRVPAQLGGTYMIPVLGLDYAGLYASASSAKESAIATQSPFESENSRLFSDLIAALSYVLDVQEDPRLYHAWRVAAVSASMAEQIIPEQTSDVFFAALLHDVGAMGNFSHIVNYPTLYSQKSRPEVVSHPQRGKEIIRGIPGLELSAEFVADHHEWWNGSGYPYRKSADQISIGAQLIRIADSADMNRRFQPDASVEQTIHIMDLMARVEVQPDVTEAFRQVISNGEFYRELVDETRLHVMIQRIETSASSPVFHPSSDVLRTLLTVFARVVDAKHGFTSGHSERVARYAVELARAMNLPHPEVIKISCAGLLHDAGKVAVPRSIIDKPGPLGPNEFDRVKSHPTLTMSIVKNIAHLSELSWIAGHHHERWDGRGYPDGLAGEEIPLLSRVLAVADAVDAITSPRSYKAEKSPAQMLSILHEGSGTQFDPQVVDAAHSAWKPAEQEAA